LYISVVNSGNLSCRQLAVVATTCIHTDAAPKSERRTEFAARTDAA
jgi:hypothetical protein